MSFSYDENNLTTSSVNGRLNVVRLLIGDTDSADPLVQDEEVIFALGQASNNVYYAGSWVANSIASKFARMVNTKLDGALSSDYDGLTAKYKALSAHLRQEGQRYSGTSLGISAGGISKVAMQSAREESDRVQPKFRTDQFGNPPLSEDYIEDYN